MLNVITVFEKIAVLGCLLQVALGGVAIPTTDSFVPNDQMNTHTYAYTGGANQFVKFTATFPTVADVGQVLLIAKTTNTPPTLDDLKLSTYRHLSPTASTSYDLEGANTGTKQVVQLNVGTSSTTIHVYMINLNRFDGFDYQITAAQSVSSVSQCSAGNPLMPASIYCSSCVNSQYVGSYCAIISQRMSDGITYQLTLNAYLDPLGNFGTFTIPGSQKKITLTFASSNNNVFNFIQFKTRYDEIAGLLNYAPGGGFNSINRSYSTYTVSISSSGTDVSVSFLNLNTVQTTLFISYELDSSSNLLLIVLAGLGAVLFIGLLVVAICIVKRMRNSSQIIHPRPSVANRGPAARPQDEVLTPQEIEKYFPTVLSRNIFPEQEHSMNNLMNNNNNNNSTDRDCVICLCAVGNNDMMKVTYCSHMFHAHCLGEWFKKNQNCPYCRQEFNKKATLEQYQGLLRASHKTVLMGVDLVSQIVHNRHMRSSIIVEEIKE